MSPPTRAQTELRSKIRSSNVIRSIGLIFLVLAFVYVLDGADTLIENAAAVILLVFIYNFMIQQLASAQATYARLNRFIER